MVSTYILWLLAAATHILHGEARHFPLYHRQQTASEDPITIGSLPSVSVQTSTPTSIPPIDDPPTLSFPTSAPTIEPSSVFPPTADPAVTSSAISVIPQPDQTLSGTLTSDDQPTITAVSVSGDNPSSPVETSIVDTGTGGSPFSDSGLSSTDTASAILLETGSPVVTASFQA